MPSPQKTYDEFVKWVENKTNEPFPTLNTFLHVCLEEAIELNLNSTINEIPFYDFYDQDDFMKGILSSWRSHAKPFLTSPQSNVHIVFRGIPVPPFEKREKILSQLYQLIEKCEQ